MTRLDGFLDKLTVTELAQTERAARDRGDWAQMLATYHSDARVQVTWFEGPASAFVDESCRQYLAGTRTFHQIGATVVQLNGARAIAETGCAVHLRDEIAGEPCDVTAFCRYRCRAELRASEWGLVSLVGVYLKDRLASVRPGRWPTLDDTRLRRYRESYRYLSYLADERGHPANQERPGADRPDLVKAVLAADAVWLGGG